ncbi:VOC family protein [Leifsonia sp. 2MCAF36]|uniref:VOC family protein n=1 Tax=Leifsonia sp. 2MCAF36 TaxID=3232988 RepID=UPI003F94F388
MPRNRSVPSSSVTPVLTYPNVGDAVAWLTRVFGFVEHVRIGDHRAQLGFGDGALIVADASQGRRSPDVDTAATHSVMVRVDDVDAHYRNALAAGARILSEPATHSYGERQYAAADLAGHRWMFTQSIADVAPEEWGGSTVDPW